METTEEKLLTAEEMAPVLRASPATVRIYARRKLIPHIKLGGKLLFNKTAVMEHVHANWSYKP